MDPFELLRDYPKLSAAVLFGAGLAVGVIIKKTSSLSKSVTPPNPSTSQVGQGDNIVKGPKISGEYKMIMVVRNDLKMGKGKIAAQCAHSAVGAVEKLAYVNMAGLRHWQSQGQPKVVVKVDSEASFYEILREAQKEDVNTCLISDAGRTQIAAGSKTVLAVGPGPINKINSLTGHLKLL